jgi:hypothetical protein
MAPLSAAVLDALRERRLEVHSFPSGWTLLSGTVSTNKRDPVGDWIDLATDDDRDHYNDLVRGAIADLGTYGLHPMANMEHQTVIVGGNIRIRAYTSRTLHEVLAQVPAAPVTARPPDEDEPMAPASPGGTTSTGDSLPYETPPQFAPVPLPRTPGRSFSLQTPRGPLHFTPRPQPGYDISIATLADNQLADDCAPSREEVQSAFRPIGEPYAFELASLHLRWIGDDPEAVRQAVSAFCALFRLRTFQALCDGLLPPFGVARRT